MRILKYSFWFGLLAVSVALLLAVDQYGRFNPFLPADGSLMEKLLYPIFQPYAAAWTIAATLGFLVSLPGSALCFLAWLLRSIVAILRGNNKADHRFDYGGCEGNYWSDRD